MRTFLSRAVLIVTVPVLAAFTLPGVAAAGPSVNLSFASSNDGASAGWTAGKGSPIDLTLGSNPSTTFAMIEFHHLPNAPVSSLSEPMFATSNYASGSPRYFITLSDGNTLWGYPPNSGLNGSDFAWAVNNGNTYSPWSAIQSGPEGGATVTGADVIADGDQPSGTVDTITCLSFDHTQFNAC